MSSLQHRRSRRAGLDVRGAELQFGHRLRIPLAVLALGIAAVLPLCAGGGATPAQGAAPAAAQTTGTASVAEPTFSSAASATFRSDWPHRIVAIGDLHGDLAHTRESLRLAGIIDASGHWAGRTTVFVQTGDVMDRGNGVRAILDLLRNLEKEAAAAGGMAIELIGNHETLNLVGDQASATPVDMASFGGEAARRAAFSQTGEYGAWLRTHKAAVIVDDTVFVHGGITPEMARIGLDAINAGVLAYLNGGPLLPFLDRRNGPLWFRGYVNATDPDACSRLDESLKILGARRMVVGHTPSDDGLMVTPCGGRLIGIDTGISEGYGIHVSALEIENGDAWAVYPGGRIDLPDPK